MLIKPFLMNSLYIVTRLPFDCYTLDEYNEWKFIVEQQTTVPSSKTVEDWIKMAHYYLANEEHNYAEICLLELLKTNNNGYAQFLLASIIIYRTDVVSHPMSFYRFKILSKQDELRKYLEGSVNNGYHLALELFQHISPILAISIVSENLEKWTVNIKKVLPVDEIFYFLYLFEIIIHRNSENSFGMAVHHLETAITLGNSRAIMSYNFGHFRETHQPINISQEKIKYLNGLCKKWLLEQIKIEDRRTITYLYRLFTQTIPYDCLNLLSICLKNENIDKHMPSYMLIREDGYYHMYDHYKSEVGCCPCIKQIEKGKIKLMSLCFWCKPCGLTKSENQKKLQKIFDPTQYMSPVDKINRKILKKLMRKPTLFDLIANFICHYHKIMKLFGNRFFSELYNHALYFDLLNLVYHSAKRKGKNIMLEIFNKLGSSFFCEKNNVDTYSDTEELHKNIKFIICILLSYTSNKINKYSQIIESELGDEFINIPLELSIKECYQKLISQNIPVTFINHSSYDGDSTEPLESALILNSSFDLLLNYRHCIKKYLTYVPGHIGYEKAKKHFQELVN